MDYGLLASMFAAFGVPSLLARRWRLVSFPGEVGFVDAVLGPAVVGLIVGRLTTLYLDDPDSLTRLSNVLVIRTGVEFWPGVAAAMIAASVVARRGGVLAWVRLAAIAPLAMVAYGAYEAACLVRDGCYGPESPVGLRPEGLSTTMLPVGVVMAGSVAAGAMAVRRFGRQPVRPQRVVLAGVGLVASVRAVASFWLPEIGVGLSRQHRTSIVVAALSAVALVIDAIIVPRRALTLTEAPMPRSRPERS